MSRLVTAAFAAGFIFLPYDASYSFGQDVASKPTPQETPTHQTARSVAQWRFSAEETSALTAHGGVHRDQAGPRPPYFPDFEASNTAALFDGDGAYFSFADPGKDSDFDFTNGDRITIEAWIDLHAISKDQNLYVVGKGRTGDKRFAADNQNWALRVREQGGTARINFLFASDKTHPEAIGSSWHRWTSAEGIAAGSGWHRIAISYLFGEPSSIQGWIDDKRQLGSWDMGGATTSPPVVDNDAIWIGSASRGASANSFRGLIDEVSIHRGDLEEDFLANRYHSSGTAPKSQLPRPELASHAITPHAVTMTIREGLATHNRWPLVNEMPPIFHDEQSWTTPYFYLPRMPYRYDNWGVRESWKPPVLVHLASDVILPAGEVSIVVRNRGFGRLWIDNEIVLETQAHQGSTDGHNPVDPLKDPPLPGHRVVRYGDSETICKVNFETESTHRVVLETVVGGEKYRVVSGEMLVGFWTGVSNSIELLRASGSRSSERHVTDSDIDSLKRESEVSLVALDDQVRRAASGAHDDYWNDRHEYAREVVAIRSSSTASDSVKADVTIDQFIENRLNKARGGLSSSESPANNIFHAEVLPILREHCLRCHDATAEGGLQLTSRELAMKGGDSSEPAITPNHPDASLLVERVFATDEEERMPPSGKLTAEEAKRLVDWIKTGAVWSPKINMEQLVAGPVVDDAKFLRRAYLDTVGVPPTESELRDFLADETSDKRSAIIDRLLEDNRFADHWVSFWQDILAENPNSLKPSLNNTGPFRWYLYEALRDRWPLDRMVTELLMFRGSEREGGAAGFGLAADNDAPFASRAHVASASLLGINLQCARCHDSPYHSTKQEDLFSLAAMLSRKDVTVPTTSTVSPGFFENKGGRESLIQVTLPPGQPVTPKWRFAETLGVADDDALTPWLRNPSDTRERLAALITSPNNQRFAQVMVNHYWKRLMGAGFVEPANDWEGATPSHPGLLSWLADELVQSGFDSLHVMRLIMNSDVYQRAAIGHNDDAPAEERYFASPDRRRMTAEQVVDSFYATASREIDVEQLTFDPESRRPATTMISLGSPKRAWEFATLSNERDRPSLALPRAQAVTDMLEAFGWTGSRQNPIVDRQHAPGVLQSGMISNGVMSSWLTRAAWNSELANAAVSASSPTDLVESLYLRFLSRFPTDEEQSEFAGVLSEGFNGRLLPSEEIRTPTQPERLGHVSWSNHLKPEANVIQVKMQERARAGDPPDPRIRKEWREAYEDVVWAIVNSPEFVFIP